MKAYIDEIKKGIFRLLHFNISFEKTYQTLFLPEFQKVQKWRRWKFSSSFSLIQAFIFSTISIRFRTQSLSLRWKVQQKDWLAGTNISRSFHLYPVFNLWSAVTSDSVLYTEIICITTTRDATLQNHRTHFVESPRIPRIPRILMESREFSWNPKNPHGIPRILMESQESSWNPKNPENPHRIPRIP